MEILLGQPKVLKLLVLLLDQLELTFFSVQVYLLQNSLNLSLYLSKFLLKLKWNFSLLKSNILLTVNLPDLLIDQKNLLPQKLKNLLGPFLLIFEPLDRLFDMESLLVLNVVLLGTHPKVVLSIGEETIGTNTANKKLADFWVVQINLVEVQSKRFVSVLAHELIKFLSKNINHYKLELILMNELRKSQSVGQEVGSPS
jgi:hypothetical protein